MMSTLTDLAVLPHVYLFVKCHEVQNSPRHSQKQIFPMGVVVFKAKPTKYVVVTAPNNVFTFKLVYLIHF